MQPNFSITRSAQADLDEILVFIGEDNLRAALELRSSLLEQCRALARSPGMGRERPELAPGLQSWPVGNYVVFYERTSGGIQIVRVLHGARDVQSVFGAPGA